VKEALQSLKPNKAAGPDEIDPEHLLYGGEALISHLTSLFNATVSSGHIPAVFQSGLLLPIPKINKRDLSNPSNYRGITILSNVSKVVEKLVTQDSPLRPFPLTQSSAGWFQGRCYCAHSAFVLHEAVQSLRDSGNKAYVAFLDVRKAFDTVWHEGLLVKLHQNGVKGVPMASYQ